LTVSFQGAHNSECRIVSALVPPRARCSQFLCGIMSILLLPSARHTNERQIEARLPVRGLCKGGLTNLVRVETQQP
jgi:hypothetical protein